MSKKITLTQNDRDQIIEELSDEIFVFIKEINSEVYKKNFVRIVDIIQDSKKEIFDRMSQIEELIKAHSIGVQNVYQEFDKIKKMINKPINVRNEIISIKTAFENISSLIESVEFKEKLEKVEDFLNKVHEAESILNR